jgi:hypothetical protein
MWASRPRTAWPASIGNGLQSRGVAIAGGRHRSSRSLGGTRGAALAFAPLGPVRRTFPLCDPATPSRNALTRRSRPSAHRSVIGRADAGPPIQLSAHFETRGRTGEMRVARGKRVPLRPAVGAAAIEWRGATRSLLFRSCPCAGWREASSGGFHETESLGSSQPPRGPDGQTYSGTTPGPPWPRWADAADR